MKGKLIVGVAVLVLISLASAGLVGYLSNVVVAEVEVLGPVFYASDGHPTGSSDYLLGINEFEKRKDVVFTGTDNKVFISEPLGITSFYPANYHMFIYANSSADESLNESGQIDAELWVARENGNKKNLICHGSTTENVVEWHPYEIDCLGDEIDLDVDDRFMWILSDGSNSIKYTIEVEGNTRIEVEAIE